MTYQLTARVVFRRNRWVFEVLEGRHAVIKQTYRSEAQARQRKHEWLALALDHDAVIVETPNDEEKPVELADLVEDAIGM